MSGGWRGRSATNRKAELPANWPRLRDDQLQADGFRCRWILPSGKRCTNKASDVDHAGSKWDHSKLRSLCEVHHSKRTAKQGNAAQSVGPFRPRRPRRKSL